MRVCMRVMMKMRAAMTNGIIEGSSGVLCLFSKVGSRKLINVLLRLSIYQTILVTEKPTQVIKQKSPQTGDDI